MRQFVPSIINTSFSPHCPNIFTLAAVQLLPFTRHFGHKTLRTKDILALVPKCQETFELMPNWSGHFGPILLYLFLDNKIYMDAQLDAIRLM